MKPPWGKCVEQAIGAENNRFIGRIVEEHGDDCVSAEFCLRCTHENVRDEVRRAVRGYGLGNDPAPDSQLTLAGYSRLQKVYSIMRNGEPVAVEIWHCSRVELLAKRDELRHMGAGCYEHAREIERYLEERETA